MTLFDLSRRFTQAALPGSVTLTVYSTAPTYDGSLMETNQYVPEEYQDYFYSELVPGLSDIGQGKPFTGIQLLLPHARQRLAGCDV